MGVVIVLLKGRMQGVASGFGEKESHGQQEYSAAADKGERDEEGG
jgi:hypothetical protein